MATNFLISATGPVNIVNGDTSFLLPSYRITSAAIGVDLNAGALLTQFYNNGSVFSGFEAVQVQANASIIVNNGVIQGTLNGIDLQHTGTAIHRIVNHGEITAGTAEVIDIDTNDVFDIFLTNTGRMVSLTGDIMFDVTGLRDATVTNTGFMKGDEFGLSGTGAVALRNSGTIEAGFIDVDAGGGAVVVNSGLIMDGLADATPTILRSGNAADVFVNSGTIVGSVVMNGAADIFRTLDAGVVSLGVFGGAGNDTLLGGSDNDLLLGDGDNDLIAGFDGSDILRGGSGNDTIFGGAGDDDVEGEAGSDRINTGSGDDTAFGGSENDTLAGQDGDDYLEGEGGSDVLDGGAGVDTLIGGDNDDILRGRDGTDFLTGGQGLDVLSGGEGADVFVYNALSESTANANRDVILDFEKGVDDINLVSVIPGVFVFRGTAGFTATGAPELRLQETASGSTIVRMDADGNGTSDMEINVAGVQGLTVDDFVL